MSITKATVQEVRKDLFAALEPVLKKHGLTTEKANATYADTFIKFSLTLALDEKSDNGVKLGGEYAEAYKQIGHLYGLVPDLLGKEFMSNGRKMAFAGIASKRSKYPIAAVEVSSGNIFFLQDVDSIKVQLNGRPVIKVGG